MKRKGRRLILAGAAALLLAVAAAAGRGGRAEAPRAERYVVRHGDTLWRLADTLPDCELGQRQRVWLMQRLNGLSGAGLTPGQALLLPADAASLRAAWRDPAAWRAHCQPAEPGPRPVAV